MELKLLRADKETHKQLMILKAQYGFKNIDETIRFLLAIHNNSTPEVLKKAEEKIKSEK